MGAVSENLIEEKAAAEETPNTKVQGQDGAEPEEASRVENANDVPAAEDDGDESDSFTADEEEDDEEEGD